MARDTAEGGCSSPRGACSLGEPLTVGALVGFPLILVGCVLATRAPVASTVDEEVLAEPLARP
jgi:hypothetical protein